MVLFELLTGKKLFLDTSEMGVLKKVQNGEILNPREINPDIDPALEKIILKSLNKDCDKRYQSAAAMIADLETFMVKKYNYLPGPVQLTHFIYRLFEKDIQREGIKVDLKPLPEKPLLREIPKAQVEPPEAPNRPSRSPCRKALPPTRRPRPKKSSPPKADAGKRDEILHIDFDEDKAVAGQEVRRPPRRSKKPRPLFIEPERRKEEKVPSGPSRSCWPSWPRPPGSTSWC